jgi:hypothetical protein
MSNCTVYSKANYEVVLNYINNTELQEVTGESLKTFSKIFAEGSLRISINKREFAGDSFSGMILGTWNLFENIEAKNTVVQKELTAKILDSEVALGIVAEPDFTETDKRLDVIFDLAERFEGIIFNGAEMLDKKGRVILDNEGNSEIAN